MSKINKKHTIDSTELKGFECIKHLASSVGAGENKVLAIISEVVSDDLITSEVVVFNNHKKVFTSKSLKEAIEHYNSI